MNAIESKLFQDSIQGLAGEYRHTRDRQAKQQESELERDLRQRALEEQMSARKESSAAQAAHYQQMESGQSNANTLKARETAHRIWDDMVKVHGDWVKDGIMDPEVATKSLQDAAAKLPEEGKQVLSDNPQFQAATGSGFGWKKPVKTPPSLTPTNDPKFPGALTPSGHYVQPTGAPKFSSVDKMELDGINKQLQQIDSDVRKGTGTNERGLNSQRIQLESKKADILKKYTGEAAGGTTSAPNSGKTLDKATAAGFLKEAGGDKNKARELATQRGYAF